MIHTNSLHVYKFTIILALASTPHLLNSALVGHYDDPYQFMHPIFSIDVTNFPENFPLFTQVAREQAHLQQHPTESFIVILHDRTFSDNTPVQTPWNIVFHQWIEKITRSKQDFNIPVSMGLYNPRGIRCLDMSENRNHNLSVHKHGEHDSPNNAQITPEHNANIITFWVTATHENHVTISYIMIIRDHALAEKIASHYQALNIHDPHEIVYSSVLYNLEQLMTLNPEQENDKKNYHDFITTCVSIFPPLYQPILYTSSKQHSPQPQTSDFEEEEAFEQARIHSLEQEKHERKFFVQQLAQLKEIIRTTHKHKTRIQLFQDFYDQADKKLKKALQDFFEDEYPLLINWIAWDTMYENI